MEAASTIKIYISNNNSSYYTLLLSIWPLRVCCQVIARHNQVASENKSFAGGVPWEAVAEALRPTPNKTIHIASEILLLLLLPLYSCNVSQNSGVQRSSRFVWCRPQKECKLQLIINFIHFYEILILVVQLQDKCKNCKKPEIFFRYQFFTNAYYFSVIDL